MFRKISIILGSLILAQLPLYANIIHIPDDAETIQAALEAANDDGSDTLLLADGVYTGEGNIGLSVQKSVVFMSENGADDCVIDIEEADSSRAFYITRPGALIGITFTRATFNGVRIENGNPYLVEGCRFLDNHGVVPSQSGGGIQFRNSQATIRNCLFESNSNIGSGGAIYATGTTLTVERTTFASNQADRFGGGVLLTNGSAGTFSNCLFYQNHSGIDGGGLSLSLGSRCDVSFCTFVENEAEGEGLGGGLYKGSTSNATVINSIFWGNVAAAGNQLAEQPNSEGVITISYCDVDGGVDEQGGWDGENILNEDPMFVEGRSPPLGSGMFFLDPESPCFDAGSDAADALGVSRMTTRVDFDTDNNQADLGMHYWIADFNIFGRLSGNITAHQNGAPVEDALLTTSLGQQAVSDAEGNWEIANAFATTFELIVTKPGWSDLIVDGLELAEGEELELALEMRRPIFTLNPQELSGEANIDDTTEVSLRVINEGDGLMSWSAVTRLTDEFDVAPWERRRSIPVTEITGDNMIYGVAYNGEEYFVSGSAGGEPNQVYVLDNDGQETRRFTQVGPGRNGFRDLAWDGELLWGASDRPIIGFTTDGDSVTSFDGPSNISVGVAWDPERNVIWACGTTTNIISYDIEGNQTGSIQRGQLRLYGLAVYPDDPDGFDLYLHCATVEDPSQFVLKANPETGQIQSVAHLTPPEQSRPEGIEITSMYDPYSVVMMAIANSDAGDRIDIWQVASYSTWMTIEPSAGEVQGGESQDVVLTLSSAGFAEGEYYGEAVFTHNGRGGEVVTPITLIVTEGPVHTTKTLDLAPGWNLVSVNLQPDLSDDIQALFAPLTDVGRLVLAKDDHGNFYSPGHQWFNIREWNSDDAIWIRTNGAALLNIEGTTVQSNDVIQLEAGWQGVAYYPRVQLDPIPAFSNIREQLIIAKDGGDGFYLPGWDFCNLDRCRAGKGYWIAMSEAADFVWGGGGRADAVQQTAPNRRLQWLTEIPASGLDMSLLLLVDSADDSEVMVKAGGRVVGTGVVNAGKAGVVVRGDDPTTEAIEGAAEGEELEVVLLNQVGKTVNAECSPLQGEPVYSTNAISVLSVKAAQTPVSHLLIETFPNPFNARLSVQMTLAQSGAVKMALYDAAGRLAQRFDDMAAVAGINCFSFNAENLSAGIYWLRLEVGGSTEIRKVALVK